MYDSEAPDAKRDAMFREAPGINIPNEKNPSLSKEAEAGADSIAHSKPENGLHQNSNKNLSTYKGSSIRNRSQ